MALCTAGEVGSSKYGRVELHVLSAFLCIEFTILKSDAPNRWWNIFTKIRWRMQALREGLFFRA